MVPGEMFVDRADLIINEGRDTVEVDVCNTGAPPIHDGSLYHI